MQQRCAPTSLSFIPRIFCGFVMISVGFHSFYIRDGVLSWARGVVYSRDADWRDGAPYSRPCSTANFPSFRWFCLCILLPPAPVTPLNSAAPGVSSGCIETLEQDTSHASLHVVPNYPRPSDLPHPSIREIPPYHCQDMPAYPPPSIKRFGHRKWFDLDAAYAPLNGDCNLNSTLRNSSQIPLLSILKF